MPYVQGTSATAAEPSSVAPLAFPSPNGVGNCLIVATQSFGAAGPVSDSNGNEYTEILSRTIDLDFFKVWMATGCEPGPNTVSVGGAHVLVMLIAEYSDVRAAAPMDAMDEGPGSDLSPVPLSVTTTETSDLLVMLGGRTYGAPGTALSQTGGYTHRLGNSIISGGTPRELALWDSMSVAIGTYTNTLTSAISAPQILGLLLALYSAGPEPIAQRGNIDYDQIRLSVRHADGPQFQMFDGTTSTGGHVAIFNPEGNLSDGGGPPVVVVGTPGDGEVPTWDEDTGTWIPGAGGGGGSGGRFLVLVNAAGISTDWTMAINDTWPPYAVNGIGV